MLDGLTLGGNLAELLDTVVWKNDRRFWKSGLIHSDGSSSISFVTFSIV